MREIKFRGKMLENGKLIYGNLFMKDYHWCIQTVHTSDQDCSIVYEERYVNPDTVGQFTGLHDKNGKEIYEGDVVNFEDERTRTGFVKYLDGSMMICDLDDGDDIEFLSNYCLEICGRVCEVIGTIHNQKEGEV